MTLELNQVAPQVKAMGRSLAKQQPARAETIKFAQQLLQEFSLQFSDLHDRIKRAEHVQQSQRFGWVGAAPTQEALADAWPLPPCPEQVTVIASDGSQILPDQHAITLYYVINTGSIIYQHGSNRKPETFNPPPLLCYEPGDLFDDQGRVISSGEVNVKRDLAELQVLVERANYLRGDTAEATIAMIDGQLALRVIDLPFDRQQLVQDQYIDLLNSLRESQALLAGYVDRPRSTFVLALLHLASMDLAAITEASLRVSAFRQLTDLDLFGFLRPGERSAIFTIQAKGLDKYNRSGHEIHFFYLNVGGDPLSPTLARVEVPAWLIADRHAVDLLQATVVRQARINGTYPYVLARAHELAVISTEEREAVEMMLAVEMRRQGLRPKLSPKQYNKSLLGNRESFRL
jgi:hypothetical protein